MDSTDNTEITIQTLLKKIRDLEKVSEGLRERVCLLEKENRSLRKLLYNYKVEKNYQVKKKGKSDKEKFPTKISISPREKQVLELIRNGLLSKEISERLSISIYTVNRHRQNIYEKMNVDNGIEAVNVAVQLGILK